MGRVVEGRTENTRGGEEKRGLRALRDHPHVRGDKPGDFYTMRTAEAIIDVRGCRLRRSLRRSVVHRARRTGGASGRWRGALVVERAEARVREISKGPREQEDRNGTNDQALAERVHRVLA